MQTVIDYITQNLWIVYIAIAIIVPLVIFLIKRNMSKKKLADEIEQAQSRINNIKSYPFLHNLNKADALAKINKEIFEIVNNCRSDYAFIQDNIKDIQTLIIDSDEILSVSKLNECKENNKIINERLTKVEEVAKDLNNRLLEILQQETNQRNEITDLKETYRQLRKKANNDAQVYSFCWEQLDSMNQHISDLFTDFESVMMGLKYDEANLKKEQIKIELDTFNEVLEAVPDLIVVAKKNIPEMIKHVQKESIELKRQNVYLENIYINEVIQRVEDNLQDCCDKIKKCQLEGVNDKLSNCENEMNRLYNKMIEEKNAYGESNNVFQVCSRKINELEKLIASLSESIPTADERYGLDDYVKKANDYKEASLDLKKEFDALSKTVDSKGISASVIVTGLKDVLDRCNKLIVGINNVCKEVSGAKYDESKAKQHLAEWSYALNEVKAQNRLAHLPVENEELNKKIEKSFEYIKEIDGMLNGSSINITALNIKIAEANTFIADVCSSAIKITIRNANKAEELIVLANNYRSKNPTVDEEASKAEATFRQGNYSAVIASLSNTLRKIDANGVNQIIKG